jgi:ribosomal protein L22
MSEETPEVEPAEAEEKPKRRRRRKAAPSAEAAEGLPEAAETTEGEPETVQPEPAESTAAGDSSADVAPQAEEEQEAETAEEEQEAETAQEEPEAEAEDVEPAAPAAPATTPAPRRRRRRGELLDVEVRAQAKYVRSSARKARLVCDHIRGKSVEEARAILAHTPRAIARDWSRLLESAVANAEHNHELIGEDLYVKAVRADEGPTIKRYRPRALGRATRIRKRTSHLTILLKPKP